MKSKAKTIQDVIREVNENHTARKNWENSWGFMAKFLGMGLAMAGAALLIFFFLLENKLIG